MMVREETSADVAGVYESKTLAFGRKAEADLVNAQRAHGKATLSLAAKEFEMAG
jgi:predicted N-acetyltransferase YhbS